MLDPLTAITPGLAVSSRLVSTAGDGGSQAASPWQSGAARRLLTPGRMHYLGGEATACEVGPSRGRQRRRGSGLARGTPASVREPIRISTAIAMRKARTGLSRAAAAIDHMAQIGRPLTRIPPADPDLGSLAPRRSATRPAPSPSGGPSRFVLWRLTFRPMHHFGAPPKRATEERGDRVGDHEDRAKRHSRLHGEPRSRRFW